MLDSIACKWMRWSTAAVLAGLCGCSEPPQPLVSGNPSFAHEAEDRYRALEVGMVADIMWTDEQKAEAWDALPFDSIAFEIVSTGISRRPQWRAEFHRGGRMVYTSGKNTEPSGEVETRAPLTFYAALCSMLEVADFESMEPRYEAEGTCAEMVRFEATRDGRETVVEMYGRRSPATLLGTWSLVQQLVELRGWARLSED